MFVHVISHVSYASSFINICCYDEGMCWGLVLKCYELRTRQHKMLKVNALRHSKHYFP
jgi:hypothetical protein